jgi:hypothetical protein
MVQFAVAVKPLGADTGTVALASFEGADDLVATTKTTS